MNWRDLKPEDIGPQHRLLISWEDFDRLREPRGPILGLPIHPPRGPPLDVIAGKGIPEPILVDVTEPSRSCRARLVERTEFQVTEYYPEGVLVPVFAVQVEDVR